ncbi:hypothetical protein HK103_003919 [Boothiomyces macroporosus]|uniref:Ras GEF n=1 Tax=Boothiomyces macroporosus TaxID=261099 RepID=A0AAD5YB52_9FUNG|nr:hypothetical protein HK103_003906 [Boothiomyces macroporosus]KAJ3262076.1 hypothetical protein HK103_003919 [Boothiomyces macroporosus]
MNLFRGKAKKKQQEEALEKNGKENQPQTVASPEEEVPVSPVRRYSDDRGGSVGNLEGKEVSISENSLDGKKIRYSLSADALQHITEGPEIRIDAGQIIPINDTQLEEIIVADMPASFSGVGLLRTQIFTRSQSQKKAHHKSIELLNHQRIASKNRGNFEDKESLELSLATPVPQKNVRASLLTTGVTFTQDIVNNPQSISEHTKYRSKRATSATPVETSNLTPISDGSRARTPTENMTAPYTAISNLRNTRMSTLMGSGENINLNTSPETVKPLPPKTFKEFYINLLKANDVQYKNRLDDNPTPTQFDLMAIFGRKNPIIDPIDRMMWIAKCYYLTRRDQTWSTKGDTGSTANLFAADKKPVLIPPKTLNQSPEKVIPGVVYDDSTFSGMAMITSGDVRSLLDSLLFPIDQDMSFAEIFLANYRFFVSSMEVFECLIGWYNSDLEPGQKPASDANYRKLKKNVQQRSLRILLVWIRNHWNDFHVNPKLYSALNDFINTLATESFGNNQKLVHAVREQRLSWYTSQYIPMFTMDRSNPDFSRPLIFEWEPYFFADNLTMVEHYLFRQVKPDMYLQLLAVPADIAGGGYNLPLKTILDYCAWFRTLVAYVATVVLKEDTTKKKTTALKILLKIARNCLELGNYNSAFAIAYGLKRPSVLIWSQAWEALPTKYLDIFREINQLMDYTNGYHEYWDAITSTNPPGIPFLGYLDEEETSELTRKINFQKYYNMFSICAELETFRLTSYQQKIEGDRESNALLVHHIRHFALTDDSVLGAKVKFGAGVIPDNNDFLNSQNGIKAMKRVVQILSFKTERTDSDTERVVDDSIKD